MAGPVRVLLNQRPADSVTLVFLFFLLALTVAFYPAIPRPLLLMGLYSGLIITQLALAKLGDKSNFFRICYAVVFPILCVILVFDSLGKIVHNVNPKDIDSTLIQIDYMLFRNHPTVILEKFINPLLTDILQLAYTS